MKTTIAVLLLTLAGCGVSLGEPASLGTGSEPVGTAAPTVVCSGTGPWTFQPGTWVPNSTSASSTWRSPPQTLCSFTLTSGAHIIEWKDVLSPGWAVNPAMGPGFGPLADGGAGYSVATTNTITGGTQDVVQSGTFNFVDPYNNPLPSATVTVVTEFDCTGNNGAGPCASDAMTLTVTVQ